MCTKMNDNNFSFDEYLQEVGLRGLPTWYGFVDYALMLKFGKVI